MCPGARSGGVLNAIAGEASVAPYPSKGRMPKRDFECVDQLWRQGFGASGNQREGGELLWGAARHIQPKERWRGEQDGAVVLAGELADVLGFERAGVIGRGSIAEERHPH